MPSPFPCSHVIREKKNPHLEEPETAVYYGPKNDLS